MKTDKNELSIYVRAQLVEGVDYAFCEKTNTIKLLRKIFSDKKRKYEIVMKR